jgi:hypothetical protein
MRSICDIYYDVWWVLVCLNCVIDYKTICLDSINNQEREKRLKEIHKEFTKLLEELYETLGFESD